MILGLMSGLAVAFQATWRPLTVLSGVITGLLLAGGAAAARRRSPAPAAGMEPVTVRPPIIPDGFIDVELELRGILGAADARAEAQMTRLEIAVQPGLVIRADRAALRRVAAGVVENGCIGPAAERCWSLPGAMAGACRSG
jgi:hypothetical protein